MGGGGELVFVENGVVGLIGRLFGGAIYLSTSPSPLRA